MAGVMEMIFGKNQAQAPQVPTADGKNQPTNSGTTPGAAPAPNGGNLNPSQNPNPNEPKMGADGNPDNQGKPQSPLDNFKDIWQTPTTPTGADGKPVQAIDPFNLDPKQLQEQLKTVDVARNISPELMQKALSGDMQAFSQILNQTVQSTLMMSTNVSNRLAKSAYEHSGKAMKESIPGQVNQSMTRAQIARDNPAFQNPVVQPILEAISSQLYAKTPGATPDQIADQAKQVMQGMAELITGKAQNSSGKRNPNDPVGGRTVNGTDDLDWEALMTSNEPMSNQSPFQG